MKKFLPALLVLVGLFTVSYTIETAKEYNAPQCLSSYNVDTASLEEPQNRETETTIVYVTDFGKKYHEYGCQYLQYSRIEKDLRQVMLEGYTPCSICVTP